MESVADVTSEMPHAIAMVHLYVSMSRKRDLWRRLLSTRIASNFPKIDTDDAQKSRPHRQSHGAQPLLFEQTRSSGLAHVMKVERHGA
jgi:hypothetical protein